MRRVMCLLVLLLVCYGGYSAYAIDIEEMGNEYKLLIVKGKCYIPLPPTFSAIYDGLYFDKSAPTEQWIQVWATENKSPSVYEQLRQYDAKGYETSSMLKEAFLSIANTGIYSGYTDVKQQEMGYLGGYKLLSTACKDGKPVCLITVFDDASVFVIECGIKEGKGDYFYYESYAYALFLSLVIPEYCYLGET